MDALKWKRDWSIEVLVSLDAEVGTVLCWRRIVRPSSATTDAAAADLSAAVDRVLGEWAGVDAPGLKVIAERASPAAAPAPERTLLPPLAPPAFVERGAATAVRDPAPVAAGEPFGRGPIMHALDAAAPAPDLATVEAKLTDAVARLKLSEGLAKLDPAHRPAHEEFLKGARDMAEELSQWVGRELRAKL